MARALLSLRLLAIYGLGATAVSVPLTGFDLPAEPGVSLARPIAAVVAAPDGGFVLDREGHVIRISGKGSAAQRVASIGRRSTPFGTAVNDRIVFGGVRCEGKRCAVRLAEIVMVDQDGHVAASVTLRRASGAQTAASALDGLAVVGRDDGTLWLNGGGTLFQVDVASARVAAEVPWLGGEPCVVDGVLYDLMASGGAYGEQGADLASAAAFRLRLHRWGRGGWQRVVGSAMSMTYGQNAYCSPGGYEIRDGQTTLGRWEPESGWRRIAGGTRRQRRPGWPGPLSTSQGTRYALMPDGALVDITGTRLSRQGPARETGVVIPDLAGSEAPPALQLDDSSGLIFWCATTYRAGAGVARCGGADWTTSDAEGGADVTSSGVAARSAVGTGALRRGVGGDGSPGGRGGGQRSATAASEIGAVGPEVHHYNLCSSACGRGVRSHSRDVVAWLVGLHGPAALSLNELCYDDSVHLTGRLPSGYSSGASYVALGTTTGCPGAVKQFGNQIRVLSGDAGGGWWTQLPTQVTTPCDHRIQECRGVACGEAKDGGRRRVFCSAHLETPRRDPDVPSRQVQEYVEIVTDRYDQPDDAVSVLAGDFNVEPARVDTLLASEGYVQAVTGPTVNGHRPPASKQIDMVYYRGPESVAGTVSAGATGTAAATATSDGATYCDIQASDHCYVMASSAL